MMSARRSTTATRRSDARSATTNSNASPYLLIVGEKEEAEGLVSVRAQGEGDKGQMSMEGFRDFLTGLVKQEVEANKIVKS